MSQQQSGLPALNAVVRDVRSMAVMLRAIAFTSLCQVTVSALGIQVITEVNGVLQATAYLSSGLFAEYHYNPAPQDIDNDVLDADDPQSSTTVFELSLSDLIVCLNIYGNAGISVPGKAKESEEDAARRKERERVASIRGESLATEMRLLYAGKGGPLILELLEGKTSTRCELSTFVANTALITEMEFLNDHILGQVIMASKDITEALQSIDTSAKEVTFSFNVSSRDQTKHKKAEMSQEGQRMPSRGASSIIWSTAEEEDEGEEERSTRRGDVSSKEPIQRMRIRSEGISGSTELDFPNQNKLFEQFSCTHDSSTSYQYSDIQRCLKALQTSFKTSLRIDDQGMMSLQCLFPRKAEAMVDPLAASNHRPDPEKHGFVELKLLPVFGDEE